MRTLDLSRFKRGVISAIAREFPHFGCRYIKSRRPYEKDETGGSISAEYCYSVLLRHLFFIKNRFPNESFDSIAEIGPGDSIGIGIGALLTGFSRYYGLDAQCYAKQGDLNVKMFRELKDLFLKKHDIPNGPSFKSVKPYLEDYAFPHSVFDEGVIAGFLDEKRLHCIEKVLCGEHHDEISVNYEVEYDNDSLPYESCDLILSQAALEHVMNVDDTYNWMASWLRRGGLASLQIDFKSHGTSLDWNGHWTYSDEQWEIVRDSKTFRNINRLPISSHLKMLRSSGFEIEMVKAVEMPSRVRRRHLAERWKKIVSDEDMAISSAYILARKL